ncbi:hypothetical protein Daesc_009830 [Daldinia eschscholtzii]|uniref:Uncharacterized protein n=1 Tax=Daldinia eschscholtzii TaxID=292717 RepID=A0AAX6M6F1_9PEZI
MNHWVPIDTVAKMLQSFSLHPAYEEAQVYNVVSDKAQPAQPWSLLTGTVSESLGAQNAIPLRDWVDKLRNISNPSRQDMADLPALKMLDFYRTLGNGIDSLRYETKHAKRISGLEFPDIDKELLKSWLKGWNL